MSTVKRQGNFISRTATTDSLKVSSPKARDNPSGSSTSRITSDCPGQSNFRDSIPDSTVITSLESRDKPYGSSFPRVASDVPDRALVLPIPWFSLGCSNDCSIAASMVTAREIERRSSKVSFYVWNSSVHVSSYLRDALLLVRFCSTLDLIPESEIDLYALFSGLVEFIVPPRVNLLYVSLPQPPDNCSNSCSWYTFFDLRLNRGDAPSKGELWIAQSWQNHARVGDIRCFDITVIGHLSLDEVLRSLDSIDSFRQGEFWSEIFHWLVCDESLNSSRDFTSQGELWSSSTSSLAILIHENGDSCLAIFSGLFCVDLLSLVLIQHGVFVESQAETKLQRFTLELLDELHLRLSQAIKDFLHDSVVELLLHQTLDFDFTMIVAHSGWLRSIFDLLDCSLPRPPEVPCGYS